MRRRPTLYECGCLEAGTILCPLHHSPVAVRRSKYKNKPVTVAGIRFASQAEAKRARELNLLEQGRVIQGMKLQPRFPLIVNGEKVCTYVGDFAYRENGVDVVEDVKGVETAAFKIKAKLFRTLYPHIELRVIQS